MKRRSFLTALPWAALAFSCGRAGQITGILPQGQGKQPFVTLRVLGLKEPITAVSSPGTALEVLQWSLGATKVKTRKFDSASGDFVESIQGQAGNWIFEVNDSRLDTPGTSVDAYRVGSGDELVFRTL